MWHAKSSSYFDLNSDGVQVSFNIGALMLVSERDMTSASAMLFSSSCIGHDSDALCAALSLLQVTEVLMSYLKTLPLGEELLHRTCFDVHSVVLQEALPHAAQCQ